MSECAVFMCDYCGKSKASPWSGEPRGWVRLEAEARWDGTNYHIFEGNWNKSFCSIDCFVKYMELVGRKI